LSEKLRILFVGVGGQGVLSASRWVGDAALACELPVVVGQIHGMSQRGGSVNAAVALGGLHAPEIPDGMADVLVALEPMEGARALAKVSNRTTAFVNTRPVLPSSLQSSGRPYPPLASLLDPIRETVGSLVSRDLTALASAVGSARSLNVVMLGMLAGSGLLPLPSDLILKTVLAGSSPALTKVNQDAFRSGESVVTKVRTA